MKKKFSLLFLCSIFYCFAANATITLSASTTTVTSGVQLTITASGENANLKINTINGTGITISPGSGVVTAMLDEATYYNPPSVNATSFIVALTNNSATCQSVPVTISFTVDETVVSGGTTTTTTVPITVTQTITVNSTSSCVPVYTGTASGTFYSQNCGVCYYPLAYTYTASATSSVSQAAANSAAQTLVAQNGQAAANQNGGSAKLPSPVVTLAVSGTTITASYTISAPPSPSVAPTGYSMTITDVTKGSSTPITNPGSPYVLTGIVWGDTYSVTVTPTGSNYGTCNVSNTATVYTATASGAYYSTLCSTCYYAAPYTYTATAASTVSQAAAQSAANQLVSSNGSAAANQNGSCTILPAPVATVVAGPDTPNPDVIITISFTTNVPATVTAPTSYLLTITNTSNNSSPIHIPVGTSASPFIFHGVTPGNVYTVTVTPQGGNYGTCNVSNTVTLTIPWVNYPESTTFVYQGSCPSDQYGYGEVGSLVTYSVPAGKYTSTVSQTAANALALADISQNGQIYANNPANGGHCLACATLSMTDGSTNDINLFFARTDYTPQQTSLSISAVGPSSSPVLAHGITPGTYNITVFQPYPQPLGTAGTVTITLNGQTFTGSLIGLTAQTGYTFTNVVFAPGATVYFSAH